MSKRRLDSIISLHLPYGVEIKSCELYEEKGWFFLSLTYRFEDDNGVYELSLPKIALPFGGAAMPSIEDGTSRHGQTPRMILNTYGNTFELLEKVEGEGMYQIKMIKEKRYEMTISEIEKALGKKIKIVNDKEDK